MGFFLITKTSNACGWKCQVTIVWDTLQMGLLQMTASDQKVTVGDCLPANLPVTVILWLSLGKMRHFILGTNTRIWMLPCHCSGATVWFRGSHIPSWIELLPPISSIFHRRLDFFSFAAVTLTTSQETGPPLTYDLLWPWSGVTVLSRHPQKSQICSGVIKVTFLDKESRASDTSVRCVLEAQPQHSWAIKNKNKKKQCGEGHD